MSATEFKRTTKQVLQEIEFELLQGSVAFDEIEGSIQAVRQYHAKLRSELFDTPKGKVDYAEIAVRQFQINEMLLALLQENDSRWQSLKAEMGQWERIQMGLGGVPDVNRQAELVSPPTSEVAVNETKEVGYKFVPESIETQNAEDPLILSELKETLNEDRLNLELDIRSSSIPVVGGIINRLRLALHHLVLFYVGRLIERQAPINRIHGDWIRRLYHANQNQQQRIAYLENVISQE